MKISSNYYDYYYQNYQLNSITNSKPISEASNSSQDESGTMAIISSKTQSYLPYEDMDATSLNYSGRMMMNSLKLQDGDPSEMFKNMDKMKKDMDSIKNADIDSMSADEVKEVLTQLQTDMKSMPSPNGQGDDASDIDTTNMSESDMKDILKKIQQKANSIPEHNHGVKKSSSFSKVKEDMVSIEAADIDSMSSDDVKGLFTQLQTDLESTQGLYGRPSNSQKIDVSTMSESDMRNMLKEIQDQLSRMHRMNGLDPSQDLNSNESDISTINPNIDTFDE